MYSRLRSRIGAIHAPIARAWGAVVVSVAFMRANAINMRRAGLLLRALSAKASWSHGAFVNARDVAKGEASLATTTNPELAEVLTYMVGQGAGCVGARSWHGSPGSYAVSAPRARRGAAERCRQSPSRYKPAEHTD